MAAITPEIIELALADAFRGVRSQYGSYRTEAAEGIIRAAVTAAAATIAAAAVALEIQARDHLIEELLENAPEQIEGQGFDPAEDIAVEYVRWLEDEIGRLRHVGQSTLSAFTKTSDGWRARVGHVQIQRWQDELGE